MIKSTTPTFFFAVSTLFTLAVILPLSRPALGQTPHDANPFPLAHIEESKLGVLDEARDIKLMDATPDGSLWYVVDAFAGWQTITVNGNRVGAQFHEIASSATRISPKGDYLIWTGLLHAFTKKGYDSTIATVYKNDEIVGSYVSDYPVIEYSRTGSHWAVLLPYAYQQQPAPDRDYVVVDGTVAHKSENYPHLFSFSHDEKQWAYRSTDGSDEKLISSDGRSAVIFKHPDNPGGAIWDPTIWRYTPDVTVMHRLYEGRDYDLDFAHVARVNRTAYSSEAVDTARVFLSFNGHNQGLYRWITNIVIDTAGNHIAYFACDPAITKRDAANDEQRGVVVYDGKVIAGPFPGVSRLFLSPSGKHVAYSLSKRSSEFYVDRKKVAPSSQVLDCVWSPDESKYAFLAVGEHDKFYVVANGKRSPLFEHIGRIGWAPGGREVEFVGVVNGRVLKVNQPI